MLNSSSLSINRNNLLIPGLIALLLVQIIVTAILFWPRQTVTDTNTPLLPGLTTTNVVKLTISDNKNKSVQLTKSGNNWVLADTDDFPAQSEKITEFLTKLVDLKTGRLVATTPASYERLQVSEEDFVRRVEVELSDGSSQTLYLGSSPQARATHVRNQDDSNVYLASNLTSFDASNQVNAWINTTYLSVPSDQIVAMTLRNKNGTLTFNKAEDGSWSLEGLEEGETFLQNNLISMFTNLTGLNMVEPLGKEEKSEYGMFLPAASVTLETEAENGERRSITLLIGAFDEKNRRYTVKSSESEYYATVNSFSVERFVERGRSDFIQVPEPETGDTGAENSQSD